MANTFASCSVKGGVMHLKTIRLSLHAQLSQADMDRDILIYVNYLHVKGPFYHMIQWAVRKIDG